MRSNKFSGEFKRDTVAQITEQGYPVREVSQRLGLARIRATLGRSSRRVRRGRRRRTPRFAA